MYMDIFMDNSMDNAEIWWVGIYVYDKWISVQIGSGYQGICLDTTDNYLDM